MSAPETIRLRGGGLEWVEDPGWAAAEAEAFGWVSSAAVLANDDVVVFQRRAPELVTVSQSGAIVSTRDLGLADGHGIFAAADDTLYVVDRDAHRLYRVSAGREPEPILAASGVAFCHPTDVVVDPATGELYVSDGYGGAAVHRFAADGTHICSFGEYGARPGAFNLVHTLALDGCGRVIVADCGNGRIQLFSLDGELVSVWDGLFRPLGIHVDARLGLVFVTEGSTRVTARTLDGVVVAAGRTPGNAHGICGDSQGNLYLSIPGASSVLRLAARAGA